MPARVTGPTGWSAVDATYVCCVTDDAHLWCWGANTSGQLGDGTKIERTIPTRMGAEHEWATVVGSAEKFEHGTHGHSCAVTTVGTLWRWGENEAGQLGIGGTRIQTRPTQVSRDDELDARLRGAARDLCDQERPLSVVLGR